MTVAVPKESKAYERRVALTPHVIQSLIKAGFQCRVERAAGLAAGFPDAQYEAAGVSLFSDQASLLDATDLVLAKVNAPTPQELEHLKAGSVFISLLYAYTVPDLVELCLKKKFSAFAMDAVPRISRAQKMDALSSQANLAGYKAVLLGANALGKIFPLMMTAAGTITPAKVLIFGAGVAGLQALATAKRLGVEEPIEDLLDML